MKKRKAWEELEPTSLPTSLAELKVITLSSVQSSHVLLYSESEFREIDSSFSKIRFASRKPESASLSSLELSVT